MNPPSQWSRWPACNLSSTCVGSHLHSLGIILKDLSGSDQVKKTNKNPKIDCTQSKSQGPFFNIINLIHCISWALGPFWLLSDHLQTILDPKTQLCAPRFWSCGVFRAVPCGAWSMYNGHTQQLKNDQKVNFGGKFFWCLFHLILGNLSKTF